MLAVVGRWDVEGGINGGKGGSGKLGIEGAEEQREKEVLK